MSDYYDGNNKEEDRLGKLSDKVQEWWDNLDDNTKYELVANYYPDKAHLMGLDEMWDGLSWNDKADIYIDFNEKDEYMSSDELYDGDCMSNFDNEEKKNEQKEVW